MAFSKLVVLIISRTNTKRLETSGGEKCLKILYQAKTKQDKKKKDEKREELNIKEAG